ncbi:importin beta-like SAD2 [Acrasis kona]|uniref:Importin beta-like SAD2 n=1 Tax=Acrasis kona TaxID=1008807 RepID=A0AAW2YSU7_9EUKA
MCFYYIGASIRNKEIYNIALKSKLETLIKDVIFPQLYYSQHDQEMWEDDLQEYLRVNFDFVTDVYSVKTSAGNALFDLLETRKEDAMQLFLQLFDQGMKQNNAKISDGMLYALGNMKKPIMTDKTLRSQLEGVMVNYVIPNFASNQAHLRARACWTAGIYALIKWENRDSLLNVVRNILNSLQDNHLIVKVQAGTSLTGFLQNASIIPEVRPLLPKLLNLYIQMMQELDYGDVVQSIDDLIEAFSSEIEPYALELLQNMVARCHTLFDQDDEDDQNDLNDDNIEEFGEGEIVCSCCLKVILTVLNSVGNKNQHLLRSAQELIVPLLEKILMDPKDRGFDYYEEVCGISASLTYFHDGELNGATIWRLFPALFHSFQQYANYYISNLISPLDNFISKGNKVFLSDRRYMDAILHILEFFLNDEEAAEKETQAAALLASVLLQSCRGQIDQDFAKIMTLVFKKLSHCETNSLKILLTNCLCDAFLYSVPMTFDFMTRTNSTAQVFGLWLQIIPKMSRVYDMKCSLLGLDSLLSYPELSHLPQVVQTNIFFIVQNCVKLLVKIEAEKKKIAEYEAEAEEESKIAEQRIMNGEHFDMQDEGFEDDFEDEDDQDEPYEQEGDQDVTGIVKTKQIQSLLKEISECEWDKQGHDDDELEEEADFNSILDTIDENLTFGTTMLKFSQKYNPQFVQITSRLSQEEQNSLRQLMSLANK